MASSHDSLVQSRPRELWADNLRVLVVAGVIVAHTATGYITGFVGWYYDELTTSTLWSTLLAFPAVAGALFGLGPGWSCRQIWRARAEAPGHISYRKLGRGRRSGGAG